MEEKEKAPPPAPKKEGEEEEGMEDDIINLSASDALMQDKMASLQSLTNEGYKKSGEINAVIVISFFLFNLFLYFIFLFF